jgi:hypothetical protein
MLGCWWLAAAIKVYLNDGDKEADFKIKGNFRWAGRREATWFRDQQLWYGVQCSPLGMWNSCCRCNPAQVAPSKHQGVLASGPEEDAAQHKLIQISRGGSRLFTPHAAGGGGVPAGPRSSTSSTTPQPASAS